MAGGMVMVRMAEKREAHTKPDTARSDVAFYRTATSLRPCKLRALCVLIPPPSSRLALWLANDSLPRLGIGLGLCLCGPALPCPALCLALAPSSLLHCLPPPCRRCCGEKSQSWCRCGFFPDAHRLFSLCLRTVALPGRPVDTISAFAMSGRRGGVAWAACRRPGGPSPSSSEC